MIIKRLIFFIFVYCLVTLTMSSSDDSDIDESFNNINTPFYALNNIELMNLYCSETLGFYDSLPSLEIV